MKKKFYFLFSCLILTQFCFISFSRAENLNEKILFNIEELINKESSISSSSFKDSYLYCDPDINKSIVQDYKRVLEQEMDQSIKNANKNKLKEYRETVIEQIKKSPPGLSDQILAKIKQPDISEKSLTIHTWAIGLTKDSTAVDKLIELYGTKKKKCVLRAISMIGGDRACDYLFSEAKKSNDAYIVFLLARMKYKPALPLMKKLLASSVVEDLVFARFCFGQMGDDTIPSLLEEINSPNKNLRINSIAMLGYLTAKEAANPLIEQFWEEKVGETRMIILDNIIKTLPDFEKMEYFLKELLEKEKDDKIKIFAIKTMNVLIQKNIKAEKNKNIFNEEYKVLFESSGEIGDIEKLFENGFAEDENKLKKLRETILSRISREAFSYQTDFVNYLIISNRFIISEDFQIPRITETKAAISPSQEQKMWALATCAILTVLKQGRHDLLGAYERNPEVVDWANRTLQDSWGIYNKKDLLDAFEWVNNGGYRIKFNRAGAYYTKFSPEQLDYIKKADPQLTHEINLVTKYYKIFKGKSIAGWDYARYVSLCEWAYLQGYLTENEAWAKIMPAARLIQNTFDSWEDMGNNCLIGREYWSEEEAKKRGGMLREAYKKLLTNPTSPWIKNKWNFDLNLQ